MPETTPPKPKCPNCDVEIEGTPEKCAKCGFNLPDFGNFFSFFKTAVKKLRAEEEAEEAGKPKPTKKSVMDSLLGPKKKA